MQALVTGAGIRIGRAVAIELARAGFSVGIHYNRSEAEAEEVAAACRDAGGSAWTFSADLATVEGCSALIAAVQERTDRLHVLVNNASLFSPVPFAEITAEDWDKMQAVNTRAPFLLVKGLLPQIKAGLASDLGGPEGQGGLVVNLCDIGADRPVSGYAHYSVSKAGLVMLTRAMAVELAPRVRAIGISPGQAVWPETYDEDLRAKLTKRIPMGRVAGADEVARLVRYATCEGFYLNGAIIPVDGGLSLKY